jgi:hypothetical protein
MVLRRSRNERHEELDSQRELERLTAFVGILTPDAGGGQGSSKNPEE